MESHDIVKNLIKKVPAKHIAQELGVSLSLVYKWAEAPIVGSGTSNPLDRIEVLTRLTGDMSPIEWLCSRFAGTFARHETCDELPPEDSIFCISQIMIELGHIMGTLASPLDSLDEATAARVRQMRLHWEKAKPCIEAFIIAAEQGRFTKAPFKNTSPSDSDAVRPAKITPTRYKRSLGIVPDASRSPFSPTTANP